MSSFTLLGEYHTVVAYDMSYDIRNNELMCASTNDKAIQGAPFCDIVQPVVL